MKLITQNLKLLIMAILISNFCLVKNELSTTTIFDFLNNMLGSTTEVNQQIQPKNSNRFRFKSRSGEAPAPSSTSAPSSTFAPSSSPAPSNTTNTNTNIVDLNDPNAQINEWLTVSSPAFANRNKYPSLVSTDGTRALIDLSKYERVNGNFATAKNEGAPIANAFWFKVRGGYIYYSSTKEDINVLDAIFAKKIENSRELAAISKNQATCFRVVDFENNEWKICASTLPTKLKWMCSLQHFLKQTVDYDCIPPEQRVAQVTLIPGTQNIPEVQTRRVVQPVIIIPKASKNCNEKFDYNNKGADWECTCKEGLEQSPIDLPSKEEAEQSPLKPMFQYDIVSSTATESTYDGLLTAGDPVKIRYDKGAIRIYHSNMGKIVTLDGAVFFAEEISFHTPSEHKINGQTFDMEMQIVHFGRTKGDIAKQIVLSFLFKSTPGVYNKFIDKLDFFNLPNPVDDFRELTQDFFIPSVFYSTDEDDIPTMQPFSFYTYQGSLTLPPCTERTTHFVAADPIPLSKTVITLFQEALKKPDMVNANDATDVIINDEGKIENTRETQPLNGRKVYLYNHRAYGCADYVPKKRKIQPAGHYEKVERDATEYIFVNGNAPSGLPGSFIVSEAEAKGAEINKK
jgi:carbonic anhydrase